MKSRAKFEERREKALERLPSKEEIVWLRSRLQKWYLQNKRAFPWRKSLDPYIICISETLLQQTSASKVAQILDLFIQKYPNWNSLAKVKKEDIEQTIYPLGLYERRANVLHKLAKIMVLRDTLPNSRNELEKLPGIGQYIANVILVVLFNKRLPFLDVNMSRLLERFFGPREFADIRYDPYLQTLSRKIVNVKEAQHTNWMILDFAALVCTKKAPKCQYCVLNEHCQNTASTLLK